LREVAQDLLDGGGLLDATQIAGEVAHETRTRIGGERAVELAGLVEVLLLGKGLIQQRG
jgi:hypothetical protein